MRIYLVLVALIAGISAQDATIEIKISAEAVNQGDTFTVECTARNLGASNFVRINKRIPGEKEGEYALTAGVSTNLYLETSYDDYADRYQVELASDDVENKITVFRLTVKDVQVKDGGIFQCSIPNVMDAQDTIVVRAPPTELHLYYYNTTTGKEHEIKDGDSFTFQDHETAKIKCIVNGSNPEPMARIQVGKRKITPNEGLITRTPKKHDKSSREEYRLGLVTHQFDTVLEIEALQVMNYGNQDLVCAAHTHGLNPPELQKSFTLKMKGMKPVFECNKTQMLYLYEKKGIISCKVHGIPLPTKFTWYTYLEGIEEEGNKFVMEQDESYGVYKGRTILDNTGGIVMQLVINRVHDQHFRTHWFIAENTMGATEIAIDVERDPTVRVVLEGSSSVACATLLSLVLPLLAMLCRL